MGQRASTEATANSDGVGSGPPDHSLAKPAASQPAGTDVTYHVDDLLKHSTYDLKFSPVEVTLLVVHLI